MATLLAIERYEPPYRYHQHEVTRWVADWLGDDATGRRLLGVYKSAGIETRASVVPIERVFHPGDFETQNDLYRDVAGREGAALVRRALDAAEITPAEVGLIVSVSCTGFQIPAVDAHVADALGMGPRLARLPITESGCAGGIVALARARDFPSVHPDRLAVVLALEFASLTFQRWDRSATNVVSTAIFGDGGAAVVLAGPEHPRGRARRPGQARLVDSESVFFPGTLHLMGFRLRNQGLQIILDRELAPFVRGHVGEVVSSFLASRGLAREDVTRWIMHPGGRRIIEVMTERLALQPEDLAPTEKVLAEHGNMSSVTVLFVLDEMMRRGSIRCGEKGMLGAFGPGFGAELALVEFC